MHPAGIYIHVPFCAVKCPYCDFYSCRYTKQTAERYAEAVCRNIGSLPAQLPADTVYFGGGTPSLLPGEMLSRFLEALRERIALSEDAEITLEVNPLTATEKNLTEWRRAGINRLSLGIQSFDAEVLSQLGRRHTPEQGITAVRRAAEAGFSNISADLMIGLALQDAERVQKDMEQAVSLPVAHISAYLLKIEDGTPFAENTPALLDEEQLAERYLQMHRYLTEQGYCHYEISNFAKQGAESRHNLKYWHCDPYYGIGPAAHSAYGGKRWAVPRNLEAFCNAEQQPQAVTEPDAGTDSERIMLGLRLAEGIAPWEYPADVCAELYRQAKPLAPYYLTEENGRLRMTPEGWLVSNAVIAQLTRNIE